MTGFPSTLVYRPFERMIHMKKLTSLMLTAALALSLLAGCAPKAPAGSGSSGSQSGSGSDSSSSASGSGSASQPEDGRATVNFTVLSGPTGVGAAQLLSENQGGATLNDYAVTVAAENKEVTDALVNGSADIAAVATNVAANLYAKTDGAIQVLAVNTLGVLYILEKGDTVHAMSDLAGKTVYATGQGANPEYVLNHLLTENGVDPAGVDIQWMTAQEVSAKMATGEGAICMLPVPAATALMLQDSGVRQAISLSDAWDRLDQGALAMGCVVARTQFAEENPQAVADFLTDYQASISYMSDEANLAQAAELVAQFGITPSAAVAAAAIPQCNLTFLDGDGMKDVLTGYYQALYRADPAAIGGAMPYDAFYYGAD